MATTKLIDFLGVLGNFGLILGLVLVGYQIKQTNDLAKAQMLNESFAIAVAADLAYVGELAPETMPKADLASSDLSDQDILVLERLFRVKLSQQMRIQDMRERGLSDTSEEFQAADFAFEIDSAFGRMYWDISKDFLNYTASFIEEVDRNLSTENQSKIDYFRAELEKRQP